MGFANGKIAKIWEIRPYDKYCQIKLSISKKGENGYEHDFSSYVRFIGKAADKARELRGFEVIKLLQVECSNKYDTTRKIMYYNFVCWDFEIVESHKNSYDRRSNDPPIEPNDDVDGLPF